MAELDSEDPSLKVISIHGMGGLGKTSLATKLYNSSKLRHFDTRAKVCVSNEYNIINVLKRIIKSFKGLHHEQHISNMDEHDLLQHLLELLQEGGGYFALIDDIWDIKAWEQIKIAFPNQKNGSRIIITPRNKYVAETVEDKCFVHQLRFLRELFCKRVEPTTHNMEKLGKEMVGKCGGYPLAIVVLSGLLLHTMSYEYWSKVKEHIWRHLKEGGSFQIQEILSLSYYDLSPQMRDCFLYLAARYPEDHMIASGTLNLLWIAEEFISEADQGVVMEDLAEDYLNRNLIQVESLELNGQALRCRVPSRLNSVILYGRIEDPSALIFLPDSLIYLKLVTSGFTRNEMATLGNLSNLTALELGNVYKGDKILWGRKAFPSLQILTLIRFRNLEELQVEDGALPSLKTFRTIGCGRLKRIPAQLERFWIKDQQL